MDTLRKYLLLLLFHFLAFNGFSQEEDALLDSLTIAYNNISTLGDDHFFEILNSIKSNPKNLRQKVNAYYFLGQYHNYKGIKDSAIYYGKKIIAITGNKDDNISLGRLARAYYLLGIANNNKGIYEKAKYWFFKGFEIAEKVKHDSKNGYLYYNFLHAIANLYVILEEYDKALKLFKQCTTANIDSKELIYGSYINMSNIYSNWEKYNISNDYLKKAKKLCKEDKNYKCLSICLLNIGGNLYVQENYDEALKYYNESVKFSSMYNYPSIKLSANIEIGSILKIQGRLIEASIIYSNALMDAKSLNLLNMQMYIYELLTEVEIENNNYKNAFGFQSARYNILDSLNNMKKNKEINELEVKFHTLQKEKEIEVLKITNKNRELKLKNQNEAIKSLLLKQKVDSINKKNQILSLQYASDKRKNELELVKRNKQLQQNDLKAEKRTKQFMIIAFLIILIPTIALLLVYYQKLLAQNQLSKKQEEINKEKINSLVKEQELKLVKASVEGQDKERSRIAQELHDSIGGNLAAIKLQFGNINDTGDFNVITNINKQLDNTYNQVRAISHNLMPKKFNQSSFVNVLNEYIKNIGDASNLQTNLSVFPNKQEVDKIDENILIEIYKIVQELITNTIKHAEATKISIQLTLINHELNILFEDNGVGFDTHKVSEGIGFTNIKTRLQKLNGVINIDSFHQRGSIINLEIPTTYIRDEV